jgi:uroporphyrinogen-III synthase
MARLLVLRPEPGASATVEKARERGLEAVAIPLFEIEPVGWQAPEPGGFDGLLLTSANAVRCAGNQVEELRGLKVYAVGAASAQAAREAGFDIASTGKAGVDRFLGSIEPDLKLLHLCGEDRHESQEVRQAITRVTTYRSRQKELPKLVLKPDDIALIHSPRSGRRFAELVSDRGIIAIAAVSTAAAEAAGEGWKSVAVAEEPSDEALLALAARLCNNPPPK